MAPAGAATLGTMAMHIPSPSVNGFHLGPVFVHYYGLMYVIGITLAILITQRRWQRMGGDPGLVGDVALWAVPAGIIGGRIYFDITTPNYIPHHWYGIFAVWDGGLGIWGGIALGAAAGIWRVRRHGVDAGLFADAVAPALLVAQAVGRIGNYFNKELFGGPTSLPWGLYIPPSYRPPGYLSAQTFQPTFLYELIFDLALAAALVWLGHHRGIKAPGLFALYVTGYSAFRIFEESLRVDPSEHFLGLRLNMYVAIAGTVAGGVWFWYTQRYGKGVPATDGAVARSTAAAQAAAEADGAADGEGEPPAVAAGEPAGDAVTEDAAEPGPGGEPPAEVGADAGGDHSAETPPAS
jgi:prolipoprotein diacylglyceryl transferase